MTVRIRETSRLRYAKLITLEGVECWELWEPPNLEPRPDDIVYTVARKDRIDLLAHAHYDDAGAWWVIALANDFRLLPNDMRENMKIRIPSPAYVTTKILKGANRGEEGR